MIPPTAEDAGLEGWLSNLRAPATKDEALELAERRGAPEEVLEFLRNLPAAVFTSEAGLHHALGMLHRSNLGAPVAPTPPSEDGEAS